jgi:AraC-like DNA-binding protein
MEVLTSVLSAMKLSGSVFLEAEFTAPWCVTSKIEPEECAPFFPVPEHVIAYHYVRSGSLYCAVGDEEPVEIRAGQIFMLPRNEMHRLGSCLDTEPVQSASLVQMSDDGGLMRIDWGGGGEQTQLYCGFLGTLTPANAFLMSLPSILVVDATQGTAGEWLASTMRYTSGGGVATSPDLVGKLAELLFAEAVKQVIAELPEDHGGWLAAFRDPYVGKAITLLHSRCAEAWTTEGLAEEVGLSRSALADRFTRLIGEPPMRYLAKYRMTAAANLLQDGRQNACNIAYSVGFNSEAAFSRAFKKEFGVPPGAWQRGQRGLNAQSSNNATATA